MPSSSSSSFGLLSFQSSSSWIPAALCFLAGAATAMGYMTLCSSSFPHEDNDGRNNNKNDDDNINNNTNTNTNTNNRGVTATATESPPPSSSSWTSFSNAVVEDISARIGELPSRLNTTRKQIPWPWDRMHKHKKKQQEQTTNSDQPITTTDANTNTTTTESPSSPHTSSDAAAASSQPPPHPSPTLEKTADLCIGSIFGLDVGGTLAKLVYFEERPHVRHSNHGSASFTRMTMMHHRSTASLKQQTSHNNSSNNNNNNNNTNHTKMGPPSQSSRRPPPKKSESCIAVVGGGQGKTSSSETDIPVLEKTTTMTTETEMPTRTNGVRRTSHSLSMETAPAMLDPGLDVRRTQSMLDFLTQREHRTQALDRFYAFARENLTNDDGGDIPPSTTTVTTSAAKQQESGQNSTQEHGNGGTNNPEKPTTTTPQHQHQSNKDKTMVRDENLSFDCLDGTFHFLHFETRNMHHAVDLIRRYELHQHIHSLGATGGGAHRFSNTFEHELGIHMKKFDELETLVTGMQFVLQTVVGECYTYRPPCEYLAKQAKKQQTKKLYKRQSSSFNNHYGNYFGVEEENWSSFVPQEELQEESENGSKNKQAEKTPPKQESTGPGAPKPGNKVDEWWWSRKVPRDAISDASTYPYLLVTIGTGVSILRVDGPRRHERISGSTIGGGTYWGLIRLLTSVDCFSDVISLAERGDPSKVDMMVDDIYGSNPEALEKLGLRQGLVASSFGKLVAKEDPAEGLKEEDLARALLLMVTNNIGQVAYLNAQLHDCTKIYFVGNFLRQNKLSLRRLSFAIDYWSKGAMEALFLEHEGYFGALGSFLLSQGTLSHFHQHPAASRSFSSQQSMPATSSTRGGDDDEDYFYGDDGD